jgi:hypothetical protein
MGQLTCRENFDAALQHRRSRHPFDRISAYKVTESQKNIQHEADVVASVAAYVRNGAKRASASALLGCTPEDKAMRLKDVPRNIARELGWNLVPAIEALAVEGIPARYVGAFIRSIRGDVKQILCDCDAIQSETSCSIQHEYARMRAGHSEIGRVCGEALDIAERAVRFCRRHGVFR